MGTGIAHRPRCKPRPPTGGYLGPRSLCSGTGVTEWLAAGADRNQVWTSGATRGDQRATVNVDRDAIFHQSITPSTRLWVIQRTRRSAAISEGSSHRIAQATFELTLGKSGVDDSVGHPFNLAASAVQTLNSRRLRAFRELTGKTDSWYEPADAARVIPVVVAVYAPQVRLLDGADGYLDRCEKDREYNDRGGIGCQ